jgi:hypothetical protein
MSVTITEKVVSSIEVDWVALAKAVEKDVMSSLDENLAEWQDDMQMRAMFLGDASDGVKVCTFLAEGDWKKAEAHLYGMDTAAREWVWDWVEKHSCNDLFDLLREQELD